MIGQLCDSLEDNTVPLSPGITAELDARLATADADLATCLPWPTLKSELASRCKA